MARGSEPDRLSGSANHLRRTHVSLLAGQKVAPKVVQERLGHRDFEATNKHYIVVLDGMHEEAAAGLDSLLAAD